jgi:benzoate/toluate 1,2-dioxygenase subunit alpha
MSKQTLRERLDGMLVDDHDTGLHRVKRSAFTDPDLFDLEMKHIFEGNWIYLAHESQIPNNGDYLHHLHRPSAGDHHPQPQRRAELLHQRLCPPRRHSWPASSRQQGTFTCPFHGWTFNNSGKLLKIKDPDDTGYPQSFNWTAATT